MNRIYLYGTIGDDWWDEESMSAARFVKELEAFGGEPVDIFVNSCGGNVFDGCAIYTAIERYEGRVTVHIDGLAASAASYCILSADEVLVSTSATMMIHDPFMLTCGNAEELRSAAEELEKLATTIKAIYAKETGMDEAKIATLMSAETWFTAEEAIECGLADGYCTAKKVTNAYNEKLLANFKHVPASILEQPPADGSPAIEDAHEAENAQLTPAQQEPPEPACNAEKTIDDNDGKPATAGKQKVAVFDGKIYEIGEQQC